MRNSRETGATFIEATIILVVVIFLFSTFFDFARYFAVRSILYRGAVEAVTLATKSPYINTPPAQMTGINATNFYAARRAALTAATRLPNASLIRSSGAASALQKLVAFSQTESGSQVSVDAVLLRPGECFTASDGYVANHPTLPCSPVPSFSDYDNVLRTHPLVIETRTRFTFLLPILGSVTLTTRALGYREELKPGGATTAPVPPVSIVTSTSTTTSVSTSSSTTTSVTPSSTTTTNSGTIPVTSSTTTTTIVASTSTSTTTVTTTTIPPCTRTCGANQILVGGATCTCYCDSGFCPQGVANPVACSAGCGGG